MHAPSRKFMIRAGIAAVAAIAIAIAVRTLLVQSRVFDHFSWGGREATILEPRWFYLLAIVPYVFLVVGETLSDLSIPQLILSCLWRSSLVAGLALALARPSIVAENTKVATVILVDVSPSITDKQLAAAQKYVDDAYKARKGDDQLFVVSF